MKAALLISHGSRSDQAAEEVSVLAGQLEQKLKSRGVAFVRYAFLDVRQPDIAAAVESCAASGAKEIIIFLHFLNSGNHVLKDIPEIIDQAKRHYPDIVFKMTPPVGLHHQISDLFLDILNRH